jgi:DNA-binding GntR family transcriptional regulator
LKRRLLVGEFAVNVRLAEERLGMLLGMSRTPIREALARLDAEGLVVRHRDGGFCPVVPDIVGIQELYEVRAALESHALQRPARMGAQHDRALLEDLRDEWARLQFDAEREPKPSFVMLDESFHLAVAEAAGNASLVELLRQVNERNRIVRMQDFLVRERIGATVEEHLAVVDALLAGDLAIAELTLQRHVEQSSRFVQRRVLEALQRMTEAQR